MLLVIVVDFVNPLIACTLDSQCRRNLCIQSFCRPRSGTGGPCDIPNSGDDGDCYPGNVCINGLCFPPSISGGGCDDGDDGDCSEGLLCVAQVCGPSSCSSNNECPAGKTCFNSVCSPPSDVGGGCDDGDDGDCEGELVCLGQVCNPSSCSSNNECSAGNTCINGVCAPPSNLGESCDLSDGNGDCVGGLVCQSSTCYEPWGTESNMPQARRAGVAGTIGNSIFLASGFTVVVSRFQPDASPSQWPSSPAYDNFPSGVRESATSAVVNGKLVVIGGLGNGFVSADTRSFDPSLSSGQWSSLTGLPASKYAACSASFGRWIYLFGGRDSNFALTNSILVFDTSDNGGSGSWTSLQATLPQPLALCAAAQAGNEYIFIMGGAPSPGARSTAILRFRPDGNGGGVMAPFDAGSIPVLAFGRSNHCATSVNGKVVVSGGIQTAASVEMFDPSTNTVSSLPSLSVGRYLHQASAIDSTLFVFGGEGTANSVESLLIPA